MRTLYYGADATWQFAGANLPPGETLSDAYLTIKQAFAGDLDEAGPEPPRLQLLVTATADEVGQITEAQDGNGNWRLHFNLTAEQTAVDLAPADTANPRVLWYDLTVLTENALTECLELGQVRMLARVFDQVES
jgi:hypothetical protein